ncbi:MAG: hypothetical protein KKC68_07370 [Candidatus Thermoplasmatota archaeon]|nr:hypothetical protein [Candidatus Thermoplasmatota archaeon]MBU1941579.1 hypothetical protein [Candidatus Thermoplasmatota archaeon]
MKLVSLVSSGIDSPVATYLLSKYADHIILVHADNRPFTDDREISNFIGLAKYLKTIMPCAINAFSIPHGAPLSKYKETCEDPRYTCIICKRMIIRYAAALAQEFGAEGIIMGDSLGQVASQTLRNLQIIDQVVSLPILRPLIGYDKQEVIKIAKQIGTYDLSIQRSSGCFAVPSKPATQAQLLPILQHEEYMNIQALVLTAFENKKKISL